MKIKLKIEKLLIGIILMLSALLNFANIGIEGYANTFYAAGVKSMMMNLKNFFFASFDPAGFVTIDKPPLGLWLQTISAKIFGFNGWSIILPQAIAGVISVWVIYHLVKRSFGGKAGLISALCLAATPIFVAASRNNTIDNLLVLSLLLACWALLIATEKGKLKYLLLSLVLVGIGFNIKMVEAYMVAPALYITYLLASALTFKNKIKHLVIGTIVLFTVSLSWAIVTDIVPAGERPFIGSSTNNTVMELIIGHNGLERIGLGKKITTKSLQQLFKNETNKPKVQSKISGMPTESRLAQNPKGGNSAPSMLRLFSKNNMSDQISWFLPLALIGFLVATADEKMKFPIHGKRNISLVLWFMWLLTEFIYFSFSKNITHTYYLTTMAPSIAALVGIGISVMWKFFKEGRWKSWILPTAVILNGSVEIGILTYNYNVSKGYKILILITGLLSIVSTLILIIVNLLRKRNNKLAETLEKHSNNIKLNKILITIGVIGLFIAPVVWSCTPIFHKMNGSSPSAGLELFSSRQSGISTISSNTKLIKFLEDNRRNEKYLVEVPSATNYGSDLILKTGEPILTLGGFSGSDPILTLDEFKKLVASGDIRYAMASGSAGRTVSIGNNSNNVIMNWIKANGKLVPDNQWKPAINSSRGFNGAAGGSNSLELYDLSKA